MLAHDDRRSLPKRAIMQNQVSTDDRNWAIYANAAGLLAFTNIPFANLLGPLLIWLKVRDDASMSFAREHARAALNFQITWTIFSILTFACVLGAWVSMAVRQRGTEPANPLFIIPIAVAIALLVTNVAVCIVGCARASDLRPPANLLAIPFVR